MLKETVATGRCDATLEPQSWRRRCGCIRTSDKLKKILNTFPAQPPPTPLPMTDTNVVQNNGSNMYSGVCYLPPSNKPFPCCEYVVDKKKQSCSVPWQVILEVVQLVQLSVTATALTLYYLIYCYMQLVYYTLRSAVYFHNADVPMKITIGIVMATSIVIGFNLLIKIEKIMGLML